MISVLLYGAGVALSAWTGKLISFLGEPWWIVMSVLGFVFGTAVTYSVRGFDSALRDTRSLCKLGDYEFDRMREKLGRLITDRRYLAVAAATMLFSVSDLITLHKLLREEARAEKARTWLMDSGTISGLFVAALVSEVVSLLFLALLT